LWTIWSLKWTLYKYMYSRKDNYIIGPVILYELERDFLGNEQIHDVKEVLSESDYQTYCDKALDDIPKLANLIRGCYKNDF